LHYQIDLENFPTTRGKEARAYSYFCWVFAWYSSWRVVLEWFHDMLLTSLRYFKIWYFFFNGSKHYL